MDTGPGLSPEKLPHLFDSIIVPNHRVFKIQDWDSLFICSEIIKRHGGDIGVESELVKAVRFGLPCRWINRLPACLF